MGIKTTAVRILLSRCKSLSSCPSWWYEPQERAHSSEDVQVYEAEKHRRPDRHSGARVSDIPRCLEQMHPAEFRPQRRSHIDLRISQLPQQKVAQPHLAAGTNHQVW